MNNPAPPLRVAVARLPKSKAYKTQATKHLQDLFPRVSCQTIAIVLKDGDFHFPDAMQLLHQIQAVHYSIKVGDNANSIMAKVQVAFPPMPNHIKVFIKSSRTQKRVPVTDPTLLFDIQAALEESTPEEEADGLVECCCCYGDYPPQDMKECRANQGHQVCKDCICRYVSEQLDGNNSIEFKCVIDEQCSHGYHHATVLEQALTPKLKRRTNDAIYRSVVQEAGVEGLWTCQKCSYMGFLDSPTETVFCPPCDNTYCTNCHRPEHRKKTCEQMKAEEDRARDPVHMAHEQMSAAVTRRCPKCLTPFVKHDGCNKMTCSVQNCNTLSCYLCGVQVWKYKHFCNHKRPNKKTPCPCGQPCELFTSTEDMAQRDREARHQAGRKVLEEAGMAPDKIMDALASPPAKKKAAKKKAPPRPVVPMAPLAPVVVAAPAVAPVAPLPPVVAAMVADNDKCIIL